MPEEKSKSKSRSKSSSKEKTSSKHHESSSKSKLVDDSIISVQPVVSLTDPCENCNSQNSTLFCPTCDLKICDQCNDKIHLLKAFKDHNILPSDSSKLYRIHCKIHGKKATKFCQSCQEFICDDCESIVHSGVQHLKITIQQAFNFRINEIKNRIQIEIIPFKNDLVQIHDRYKQLTGKLQSKVQEITNFTRNEAESMILRLNRSAASKTSKISPDFDFLAMNLNKIDNLEQQLVQIYQNNANSLVIFNQTPEMNKIIDQIKSTDIKQLSAGIDQIDFDLPEEMRIRTQLVTESAGNGNLLKAKENIIQQLQNNLNSAVLESKKEIYNWENLVQEYLVELKESAMKCCFCGIKCGHNTVNTICSLNNYVEKGSIESVERAEKILENNCEIEVEEALRDIGNDRHYFIKSFE